MNGATSLELGNPDCALSRLVKEIYIRQSLALVASPSRAEPSDAYFERVLTSVVTRGGSGQPQWLITDRRGFDAWLSRVARDYAAWRAAGHDAEIAAARGMGA